MATPTGARIASGKGGDGDPLAIQFNPESEADLMSRVVTATTLVRRRVRRRQRLGGLSQRETWPTSRCGRRVAASVGGEPPMRATGRAIRDPAGPGLAYPGEQCAADAPLPALASLEVADAEVSTPRRSLRPTLTRLGTPRPYLFLLVALSWSAAVAPAAAARPVGDVTPTPAQARPAAAAPRPAPPRPAFTLVDASAGAEVRTAPGGRMIGTLAGLTPLGTPQWLWAVATSADGRWGRVVLPWRPNGRTGWIRLRGRRIVRSRVWVEADLSQRRVVLMRGTGVVRSFVAAIGAASSPTPIGRFSVTDPISTGDPAGPYGWYAFGLSGHQPNLPPGWTGGDQLAIHGTNQPSLLGRAVSAGCLRVANAALGVLRRYLRPGTPVIIHP
jgi:lipoprotein-anchoring transpeptidase ErfK/SrfK